MSSHRFFLALFIAAVLIIFMLACSLTPAVQPPTIPPQADQPTLEEQPLEEGQVEPTQAPSSLPSPEIPSLEKISIMEPLHFDLQSAITLQGVSRAYTLEEQIAHQEFVFQPSFDLDISEELPVLPANATITPPGQWLRTGQVFGRYCRCQWEYRAGQCR